MASLVEKQAAFSQAVARLIQMAHTLGYQVTFGDAYRDPRCPYGQPNSLHKSRLAVDLNVFRDGKYLTTGEQYTDLGEFWESIGGAWGGRFNDGNHFSFEHNGYK
jgi:hypothetical protein